MWVCVCVKALSDVNKLRSGLTLAWQDIMSGPLWNSRLFTVDNKMATCRFLIGRSVLRVRDLVDSDTWSVRLPHSYRGPHKLKPAAWDKLLQSSARAGESKLPITGKVDSLCLDA